MTAPWTCPFCPLRCDDLVRDAPVRDDVVRDALVRDDLVRDDLVRDDVVRGAECPKRDRHLGDLAGGTLLGPLVAGRPASWAEALQAAARRLGDSAEVQVDGFAGDLQTARAAVATAAALAATLRLDSTATLSAVAAATARDGVTAATLADVRMHADRVLILGDPHAQAPRLAERFLTGIPQQILHFRPAVQGPAPPDAAAPAPGSSAAHAASDGAPLDVDIAPLPWLRSLLWRLSQQPETGAAEDKRGSPAAETWNGADHTATVEAIAGFLESGRMRAVIVMPGAFDAWAGAGAGQSELGEVGMGEVGTWLLRVIERLNDRGRGVLVSLDPAAAARQSQLWLTGFSGPLSFAARPVEPLLVGRGEPGADEADRSPEAARPVRVRLQPSWAASSASSASGPDGRPIGLESAERTNPTPAAPDSLVLLGDAATPPAVAHRAAVFLPVRWPGVDASGTTVRGDSTVTLPLGPLVDRQREGPAGEFTAAEALQRLAGQAVAAEP
ncbi:molybdopterin-binding domain-containing protein [Roseimaritima sediminicola]|uniref:hypothetical protein n=1 Tax=Roseimaritima sediminicola TaxID=2662066 RepID=UPI0012984867|nr:hypothetical protein [Roseimaritima sediminicola]